MSRSTAKKALLGLALVSLAGAETMWSIAISNAPDPQCWCSDVGADSEDATQSQCCDADANPCGCESSAGKTLSTPSRGMSPSDASASSHGQGASTRAARAGVS